MASNPQSEGFVELNYQITNGTQVLAGSDVAALIIYPDDEERLRFASEYLEAVAQMLGEIPGGTPTTVEERAISNLIDRQGTADFLNLVNLQSVTVSTFRNKTQVRALGQVNPRGFARGSRTIGGTMILTEFDRSAFYKLVKHNAPFVDTNIGDPGSAVLPDQIAPFDMVLLFQHELGALAYRYLYGIEIVTDGMVYSIQDMYHENTISFFVRDVTPLIPKTGTIFDLTQVHKQQSAFGPNSVLTPRIATLAHVQNGKEIIRQFRQRKAARDPFK